jgi:Protein of unknown function (DUF2711)
MSVKSLSKRDKFASCPDDGKILDYYREQFDSVYVLLSPFIKPIDFDIEQYDPKTWDYKYEIIEGCEPVLWQEILKFTKLNNISEIDIGLRTSIGSLKEEFKNKEFSAQLGNVFYDHKILQPTEGYISEFLENRLFSAIKNIGYLSLWVSDEWDSERKLYLIDELIDTDELRVADSLFTPDKNLLITSHWDSHCSFLCANRPTIEKILAFDNFEGFYCTDKTEVYWGLYEI